MKKNSLLKIVNMFVIAAFFIAAGAMILYRWGPASMRGGFTLYEAHETAGLAFIGLGLLHLVLNTGWIKSAYFKKRR